MSDCPAPSNVRPRIQVGRRVTVKFHSTPQAAQAEAQWFKEVPWACPQLIAVKDNRIVMETLPVTWHLPGWRPVKELHELIVRLHSEDVHHRDIHPGNVVQDAEGKPRLIDWETAIRRKAPQSYDLVGRASGVPDPERHLLAGYSQWWRSSSQCSIERSWGEGVPGAEEKFLNFWYSQPKNLGAEPVDALQLPLFSLRESL